MASFTLQEIQAFDKTANALLLAAVFDMTKRLNLCSPFVNLRTGQSDFDTLSTPQQLAILDYLRRCLIDSIEQLEDNSPLVLKTVLEACMAFVQGVVEQEVVSETSNAASLFFCPERKWRMFLEGIFKLHNWKISSKNDLQEWNERLADFSERMLGLSSRNTVSMQTDTVSITSNTS